MIGTQRYWYSHDLLYYSCFQYSQYLGLRYLLLILPVLAVLRPPALQYSQYSQYEMYSIPRVYSEYKVYWGRASVEATLHTWCTSIIMKEAYQQDRYIHR